MKTPITYFTALCLLAVACKNKPQTQTQITDTVIKSQTTTTTVVKKAPEKTVHTDTLQLLYFDGNGDYWLAFFMNARKDTLNLITDDDRLEKLGNHMMEVKWQTDTFDEPGDEGKFEAKHLLKYKEVPGQLFAEPLKEADILKGVANLPEVKAKNAKLKIINKPTEDLAAYVVEAGTETNGSYTPLFTFRVYRYPFYQIVYYDAAKGEETSLADWRSQKP